MRQLKLICEYRFNPNDWGYASHVFFVIGQLGAVHLHITDFGEERAENRYSGGIEVHYRAPPDYMAGDAPSHEYCWILKCPCWHDGSSMQATDYWIPLWKQLRDNPTIVLDQLRGEYMLRFHPDPTEEAPKRFMCDKVVEWLNSEQA